MLSSLTLISLDDMDLPTFLKQNILVHVLLLLTGGRLQGAIVRIGQDPNRNNPDCGPGITSQEIQSSHVIEVTCELEGRYISIHLPPISGVNRFLNLCEVETLPGICDV